MNIEKETFIKSMEDWIASKCGFDKKEFNTQTDLVGSGILDSLKLILFYSHAENLSGSIINARKIESLEAVSIDAMYQILSSEN